MIEQFEDIEIEDEELDSVIPSAEEEASGL